MYVLSPMTGLDSIPTITSLLLVSMLQSPILLIIVSLLFRRSQCQHGTSTDVSPTSQTSDVSPQPRSARGSETAAEPVGGEVPRWEATAGRLGTERVDVLLFVTAVIVNSIFLVSIVLCVV